MSKELFWCFLAVSSKLLYILVSPPPPKLLQNIFKIWINVLKIFQYFSKIPQHFFKNFTKIISKFPPNLFSWFYNSYVSLKFSESYFRIFPSFSKIPPNFFCNALPLIFFYVGVIILQLPRAISSKLSIFVYFRVAPKYFKNLREIFLKCLQNFSMILEFFDNLLKMS